MVMDNTTLLDLHNTHTRRDDFFDSDCLHGMAVMAFERGGVFNLFFFGGVLFSSVDPARREFTTQFIRLISSDRKWVFMDGWWLT